MNLKFHQPDYTSYNLYEAFYTAHRVTRRGVHVAIPTGHSKPRTLGICVWSPDGILTLKLYPQRQGNAFQ